MFLPMMRDRLLASLSGAPDLIDELVRDIAPDSSLWDLRPDPDRYTLREILGHLAALEGCWLERIRVTRGGNEEGVELPAIDVGLLEAGYTSPNLDPAAFLATFRAARAELVALLQSVDASEWRYVGRWARAGVVTPITLEEQAMFFAIHDGYHTTQIAQWLAIGRRG